MSLTRRYLLRCVSFLPYAWGAFLFGEPIMRNLGSESPIVATQSLNEGDWVEGAQKWWWKYVFPTRESFWSQVVARASGPEPDPWHGQIGELLEGIVMLRTSAKLTDRGVSQRLSKEAINKITETAGALQKIGAK